MHSVNMVHTMFSKPGVTFIVTQPFVLLHLSSKSVHASRLIGINGVKINMN